jgi:cellulose synthase/poly-beta-1,6-N-acetylglucosamine synthase-like glycosyltransferase
MKGPFSFWTFFGLTLWIDIITLAYHKIVNRGRGDFIPGEEVAGKVSVLIPAHKEECDIQKTIHAIYREKYPIKKVIVIGDYFSDKTEQQVRKLSRVYGNLFYLKCPDKSKAKKINFAVANAGNLGDFVYVRDVRVRGENECIQRMMKYFNSEDVGAVTSYGYLRSPKNFISRSYFYGKAWINEIGRFRKHAQEIRKAVFVICGASTIYRYSVLKEIPVPHRSKTEDTYHTWLLQLHGYRVRVADDAIVSAPDIDGKKLEGIKAQIKQSYRWNSGTIQCLYSGESLHKNKRLFYSTILPGFIESVMYTLPLALLPILFFVLPAFALGFLIGDTVFSLLGTLIFIPKSFVRTLIHYPQIVFFKYINSLVFLVSFFSTSVQAVRKQTFKWSNEWDPPQTHTIVSKVMRRTVSRISDTGTEIALHNP